jgi:Family of unknown function (DUF6152)
MAMDRRTALLLALVGFAGSALAHHGTANFDLSKQLELDGTVVEMAFVNPHSYIYLDVADENGQVVAWRCEMRAATALRRSGWTPEMFKAGRRLKVLGSPSRQEPHTCYVSTIEFPDGSEANRYSQLSEGAKSVNQAHPARLANGKPNIGGDWAAEQRVMTDPRGRQGRLVPLSVAKERAAEGVGPGPSRRPGGPPLAVQPTAAGRQAAAGFDAQKDNPRFHCQPTNIFMDWTFDQHVNRIVQTDDTITLNYGFMDLERTIHMDMTKHPADIAPTVAGHSIGRWDGDVLVVDTVGFAPGYLDARRGVMYSNQMHVVERFTYDPDKRTLTRSWTAEDPLYFTGQYTGQDVLSIADIPYQRYNCDDRTWQDKEFSKVQSAAEAEAGAKKKLASRPWWKFWD